MNRYEILRRNIEELFVDDIYVQHQQITKYFNSSDLLFRMEQDKVIVYSKKDPDVQHTKTEIKIPKSTSFSLRANVQKRVKIEDKNPRVAIREPSLIREWLRKQAQNNGFSLTNFFISNTFPLVGYKCKNNCRLTFNVVDFLGNLVVNDIVLFEKALCEGIGISSSKNFGMGLIELNVL